MAIAPSPQHLDVSYEPEQDRIVLVVRNQEGSHPFWLTRRLLRAVLGGMVTLLARSSSVAGRAGSDVRTDVLLFEHVDALTRRAQTVTPPAAEAGVTPRGDNEEPRLLRQVDLTAHADQLSLTMVNSDGQQTSVALSRDNAHQLISMLYDRAVRAEWDLHELGWLARRSQVIIPQGVRQS
jgi:hypothetical protein